MTQSVPFAAWDRSQGIGASELPALAGLSPWSSPVSVWLDKMGLGSPRETDVMRAGRDLERTVLAMAGRALDTRLVGNRMTFPHPAWPAVPLYATPDGFGPRRTDLVECKVVAHRYDDWKAGPPAYVDVQVQGQLACLPRTQGGFVAALIGGEVKTWYVARDPDRIAELEGAAMTWWVRHVQGDRAPDPTTDDDAWALIRASARVAPDRQERIATPDEQRTGTELRSLLAQAAAIDSEVQARRLVLAKSATDSDVLGLGWRASWSPRSTVAWRDLAGALGIPTDTILDYTRTSPAFTFRQGKDEP